jgi:hypothetical protein
LNSSASFPLISPASGFSAGYSGEIREWGLEQKIMKRKCFAEKALHPEAIADLSARKSVASHPSRAGVARAAVLADQDAATTRGKLHASGLSFGSSRSSGAICHGLAVVRAGESVAGVGQLNAEAIAGQARPRLGAALNRVN